jgi:hypothetical protein
MVPALASGARPRRGSRRGLTSRDGRSTSPSNSVIEPGSATLTIADVRILTKSVASPNCSKPPMASGLSW